MTGRVFKQYAIPQDWTEEDGYLTVLFCIPNSPAWRQIASGLVSSLTYGRIWDERTGNIRDTQEIAEEILSSMAMCDLQTQLERIATALESLDQKAGTLVTWDEILEDIETTVGTSNLIYQMMSALLGLIPSFRAIPLPLGQIVASLIESITWRAPILTFLGIMSTSLATMAATGIAGTFSAFWNSVFAGLTYLTTWGQGMKSIMFGEKAVWNDIIWPIVSGLVFQSDGGSMPDDELDKRIQVRVTNELILQQVVNSCCAGLPDVPTVTPGNNFPTFDQQGFVGFSTPVNTPQITWGAATTDGQKCQAAQYIWEGARGIFGQLAAAMPDSGLNFAQIMSSIITIAGAAIFVPVIAIPGLIGLATVLAGVSISASVRLFCKQIEDALIEHGQDVTCALYSNSSVGQASEQIRELLSPSLTSVQVDAAMLVLNYSNLTSLFYDNPNIDTSVFPNDCSFCEATDYLITPMPPTPTTGQPAYPGGNFTSSTSDGVTPAGNAVVNLEIAAPVDQQVTINSISQPAAFPVQVVYTDLNGATVQSPFINSGQIPIAFNINGQPNAIFRVYGKFGFVGSFIANITASDL